MSIIHSDAFGAFEAIHRHLRMAEAELVVRRTLFEGGKWPYKLIKEVLRLTQAVGRLCAVGVNGVIITYLYFVDGLIYIKREHAELAKQWCGFNVRERLDLF